MARSLPVTIIEAVTASTTGKVFIELIELTHPDFTAVRFCNNTENVIRNGDTYLAFGFSVILPPDQEDLSQRAQIIVQNVGLDLIDEVRTAAGDSVKISASIYVIDTSDPDTALQSASGFEVSSVDYDAERLVIELARPSIETEAFPKDIISPSTFPGLF